MHNEFVKLVEKVVSYVPKPCPWCGETPCFKLPISGKKTWLWSIKCLNSMCSMNPETRKIGIRNTTKMDIERQESKVQELVDIWNRGNPMEATHRRTVTFR